MAERRKLEELNLMDDFLFYSMMAYPYIGEAFAKKILELLFQKKFENLKIVTQKVYGGRNTDLRGARLDVYVEDERSAEINSSEVSDIYDLEPDQNNKSKSIMAFPKRVRFYHAIIDSRSLKAGEDFGKLKNVYVIFICNYDPFGYDRIKYTIKNTCIEAPEMPYEDGAQTIVLYTKGKNGDISEELRQFLIYMENTTKENAVNEELKEIQEMVDTVKQDGGVSLAYMKGFERDMLMYEEGREEERKNTERERERAEKECKRAEKECERAEKEYLRANTAEEENRKLKEKLEQMMRVYGNE